MPDAVTQLEALPGVGFYTARAIATFAFDSREIFIETNIRQVIIHEFLSKKTNIDDTAIHHVLEQVIPKRNTRNF